MLTVNFNPFPTIETERLLLRKILMSDVEELFLIRSRIETMKYIGKPLAITISEVEELIQKMNDNLENNLGIAWGISFKNESKIIGSVGYHRIEKEHYRAEIGYQLLPDYWNKGIMNEAVKAIIDYAFNNMKLHSIEAKIDPNNKASAQLLKKNNFISEAHFKENYFFNGEFIDTEIFSLLNKK
jgi:ribosomal-protein-alanine N-acetyltransferase